MSTNYERVGKALELLRDGLAPFVERELLNEDIKSKNLSSINSLKSDPNLKDKLISELDIAALLKIMIESWNDVFRLVLGTAERSCVFELRTFRNKWAHQETFSSDDTYRMLDSASRLLTSISAPQARSLEQYKQDHLRIRYEQQVRNDKKKSEAEVVESAIVSGLKPWREVISPHSDVASGTFRQAEFAADLWQVHLGEGESEYRDPQEFFSRTFLTESIKQLLINAVERLSKEKGQPVIQLQTNFGGGKTHSMLALYHLFSGVDFKKLQGVEQILDSSTKIQIPDVKRVVLVGNKISPGNPITKEDGTIVNTLWGELAWQLGGREAFDSIRNDDENATNPGDSLRKLFNKYGPALILIDEWVAYARQLHNQNDLPAGNFETHFTFAQALTESAKLAKNCLLVVSLPASDTSAPSQKADEDVEVGGQRGREALDRLRNAIGRVDAAWRPASAEEGFEIVRRRLFEPLTEQAQFFERDKVAKTYSNFYRSNKQDFPSKCGDIEYQNRIKSAYPIHPEIFDRLFSDWSALLMFQRTRGVLRLMAAVIHYLWDLGDKSPLIHPADIPISNQNIQQELTRYLADNWVPIIERDIDGENSIPRNIDNDNKVFGKFAACRKIARTIYIGSAPNTRVANPGLEDKHIKLGCVTPSESPAVFGDALRRLSSEATYLYQDGTRYWYSTKPTVTKLAEDRAQEYESKPETVIRELEEKVRGNLAKKGDFSKIHPFPQSAQEVPDLTDTRLVVIGTNHPFSRESTNPAEKEASNILEFSGSTNARIYKNTLIFLAPDQSRLPNLESAIRHILAWQSIVDEKNELDLTQQQVKQATTQVENFKSSVNALIPEVFKWILIPKKSKATDAEIEWDTIKIGGQEPLAELVCNRLRKSEELLMSLAGTRLRLEIDRIPLWQGNHISINELCENFSKYLYLPRILDQSVLLSAITDGLSLLSWQTETFAFADDFDPTTSKYRGLRCGESHVVSNNNVSGFLVKPEVALAQKESEQPDEPNNTESGTEDTSGTETTDLGGKKTTDEPPKVKRRFYGSIKPDPERLGLNAGQINEQVISRFSHLTDASIQVTLDIQIEVPSGISDELISKVEEDCSALKFDSFGFEEN